MEYCICSFCNRQTLKDTSLAVYFEDGSATYMCETCTDSPVRTPFCSECMCTENLIQIYKNGDAAVYGCEEHYLGLVDILGQ
jgi:hypothetical protein